MGNSFSVESRLTLPVSEASTINEVTQSCPFGFEAGMHRLCPAGSNAVQSTLSARPERQIQSIYLSNSGQIAKNPYGTWVMQIDKQPVANLETALFAATCYRKTTCDTLSVNMDDPEPLPFKLHPLLFPSMSVE
jgi:hypothetical protein